MLSRKIYNLLFLLPLSVYAQSVLVLDAGHTPQNGGAISATGQYEVSYNDRFVAELKPELEKSGWKVLLTRTPTQERSLKERAEFANRSYADLFLSIHHDSAQLADLQAIQLADKTVYQSHYTVFPCLFQAAIRSLSNLRVWQKPSGKICAK